MKNNIIKHLILRLVIPVFILFLIWKFGKANYGGFEKIFFFSSFSFILFFAFSIFILRETIFFHREKNLILRNINIGLLILSIPFFVFMAIVSFAIINY